MIIILYVMDSLRADFLSCYGYEKETSPNIDVIANEGVLFTNAFAQSTWTRSSAASILSSTYPSTHGLWTVLDVFPQAVYTLPEQLKTKGYKTIAVSTMANISPFFGFGRGFDFFIELYNEKSVIERRRKIKFRGVKGGLHFKKKGEEFPITTSEDINEFVISFLKENREKDVFVLTWSLDTHDPYFLRSQDLVRFYSSENEIWFSKDIKDMNSEKDRKKLMALYADMIYYNDFHIGVLSKNLKKMGLYDQTFFILTSDHGESFGEHGVNSHGGVPFDELIRIPLIMKFPDSRFYGKIMDLVQHIDIFPTILDIINASRKHVLIQGKSSLSLIREKEKVNDFVLSETQLNTKLPKQIAIRTKDYKYIEVKRTQLAFHGSIFKTLSPFYRTFFPKRYLFYLKEDPGELRNCIKEKKDIADQLKYELNTLQKMNKEVAAHVKGKKRSKADVNEEIANHLRALGYFE